MNCHEILFCFGNALLSYFSLGVLVLIASSLLVLAVPFPFKGHKTKFERFLTFFAIGFTSLVIGYMSALARETGIPAIVSAVITGFAGYIIYMFLGKDDPKFDVVGSSLGVIYFMGFLLYGGLIGAQTREWSERLELPEKLATQEQVLKAARKDRGLEKGDFYH